MEGDMPLPERSKPGKHKPGYVVTDPRIYRLAVAHHEAGHGVFTVLSGLRFRYITLRPHDRRYAGHVLMECSTQWWNWHNEAASSFAGVIAEDMWWFRHGPPTDTEGRRRVLTQRTGNTDMTHARDSVRTAVGHAGGEVLRMAMQAWESAVRTIAAYEQAVTKLAELLLSQGRAVTWTQAREVVASCKPREIPDSHLSYFMRPWFLEHSRLSWQTRDGSCTPVFAEPVAARNTQEG